MTESQANLTQPRPTLRTIAYLTGLGVSTVSRALKDGKEISVETRARVKLIAQQIGYRPNRAGVRLKTGKTNVISVVLNAEDGGAGFFSEFVYGISDGLKGTSYHLVVTPYSLSDPMEPIRYIVETESADGVIISRIQPNDPRVRFLLESGMSFATHGRTEMGLVHPFHDYDNEAFGFEAVRRLQARGRKRLALLGPPSELSYHRHTHLGFERGLRHFQMATMPLSTLDTDAPLAEIRKLACIMAGQAGRPDGFVCSASPAAIALATGLADGGLVIGKDFDVVTKHTSELAAMMGPNVISIPEDFREAGRQVARMVMASIAGIAANELQNIEVPNLEL
jgi:LacI family transcriptional regulator